MIHIEASQGGVRKYLGTNVYVLPHQWDRRRMMIVDYPNAEALNAYLFEMIVNLERVELDLWKRGVAPTIGLILASVDCDRKPVVSVREFFGDVVMRSARRESTKCNLLQTVDRLYEFRSGLVWQDITYSFLKQFEVWLNEKGFAPNTVLKHLRNLRTLINEAVVSGYFQHDQNPFLTFRLSHPKPSHAFLYPDELTRLENLSVVGKLAHTKDAFLFCCYTGLRYSDFCLLQSGCLNVEEACLWLRINMKKTGVAVSIPLTLLFDGKGVRLLEKYESVEEFARICSNSKVNVHLKALQKMAGIRTRMTFHVARHTCATLLCHQGVPITTVQRILGHTSVSTTQIYQEVMAETIIRDLKKVSCNR